MLLVSVLGALGLSSSPAEAATVKAGCVDKKIHQSYYAYHYDMHVHWCWTAGTTATSKISKVGGWPDADGNLFLYETQKEFGPAHSDHGAFSGTEKYTAKVAAYGGFQSRGCAAVVAGCTNWVWHKDIAVLLPGGKYTWSAN